MTNTTTLPRATIRRRIADHLNSERNPGAWIIADETRTLLSQIAESLPDLPVIEDCTRDELIERIQRLQDMREADRVKDRGKNEAMTAALLTAKKAKRLANKRADDAIKSLQLVTEVFAGWKP